MKNTIISFGLILFCVIFFVKKEIQSKTIQDLKPQKTNNFQKPHNSTLIENMPIIIIKRD
uniref:hypothetical protein n=1 Tax=Flavobacterium sp. TaxID=239 RepID=UPI00404B67EB